MAVGDSKVICLILSSPDEVHYYEIRDKTDWRVQCHEKEKIEEVWLVFEAERLNYTLVANDLREAEEHDHKISCWHHDILDDVLVNDMSKFMVDNSTYLILRLLLD